MYHFEFFNNTRILFGKEERNNLAKIVSQFGNKALLVYGGNSIKQIGLYNEIVDLLYKNQIDFLELSGIKTNPNSLLVNEGAILCRRNNVEVVIAVGGGSVIDTAKAISVANFYDGDVWDILEKKVNINKALPVIAISTISGSGTEMNNSCVISNDTLKIKRGFSSELIRPKVTFLDPELTYSVGKFLTACGAADSLSHVLDTAYMVNQKKMEMLNRVMESICRTIIKYAPIAINEPNNYEARANLMWASIWGLNGFIKNGVRQLAACHAIEHELSGKFNLVHGAGMAIVMPKYYEYILSDETSELFAEFYRNVFCSSSVNLNDDAKSMINSLKKFFYNDLELPENLSDLGIAPFDAKPLANNICWGKDLPGLVTLSISDVNNILLKSM